SGADPSAALEPPFATTRTTSAGNASPGQPWKVCVRSPVCDTVSVPGVPSGTPNAAWSGPEPEERNDRVVSDCPGRPLPRMNALTRSGSGAPIAVFVNSTWRTQVESPG